MGKLLTNRALIFTVRLLIGGVFLYACADKIASPERFAIAVDNYRFLPPQLVNLWAVVLPWLELFLGLFMVLGVFVEASALLSAMMYLSFFVALAAALSKGLDISCGCFELDEAESRIGKLYLVRDFSLMVASLWIMLGYRGGLALESFWRKKRG